MKWNHSNFKKNFIGKTVGEIICPGDNSISIFIMDKKPNLPEKLQNNSVPISRDVTE